MAVKILIYRKVRSGKEKELSEAVRNLRSEASMPKAIFLERLCAPLKILLCIW
ncbi:MAG: hypothetical protein ACREBU_21690 [Nitrososphaera sp.]